MSEYCENCRILQAENNRLKNYTCGFTDCVYMQKGKKLEAEISVLRSANKSLEVKVEALEAAIKSGREKGWHMSGFYGDGWKDAVAFIYQSSLEAGE